MNEEPRQTLNNGASRCHGEMDVHRFNDYEQAKGFALWELESVSREK